MPLDMQNRTPDFPEQATTQSNSLRSGNQTGVWTPAEIAASGDFIRWLRIMP